MSAEAPSYDYRSSYEAHRCVLTMNLHDQCVSIGYSLHSENAQRPEVHPQGDCFRQLIHLFCPRDIRLAPQQQAFIDTGVKLQIPSGYCGIRIDPTKFFHAFERPGSRGYFFDGGFIGYIGSDYRNTIRVLLLNPTDQPKWIARGDTLIKMLVISDHVEIGSGTYIWMQVHPIDLVEDSVLTERLHQLTLQSDKPRVEIFQFYSDHGCSRSTESHSGGWTTILI